MKILIQTLGSAGDAHPFIGIGKTLRERGHHVVLFANEVFRAPVERAGLSFIEMGNARAYEEMAGRPEVWHRRKGMEMILQGVVDHLEESVDIIEGELDDADVLVNSSLGMGARLVRDIHSIPLVTAQLAPSLFRSSVRLPRTEIMWVRDSYPEWLKNVWWRIGDLLVDRIVAPELNRVRASRGLEPVSRVLEEWAVYSPDSTIGLFPEWFGPPQSDWARPVELVGFPLFDGGGMLDEESEAWMAQGTSPIVFTAGSANLHARKFFDTAVDVCEALGVRGLLVTGNKEDVPANLPPWLRHEHWAPFRALLPKSRALASHGGVGTTAQALAAGIPHLVTHVNFDQRDNGSRVADIGAGLSLPMREFNGRKAVEHVTRILSPTFGNNAAGWSRTIDPQQSRLRAAIAIEAASKSATGRISTELSSAL